MTESAGQARCAAPVVVLGVFSSVSGDTGHLCVRESGHDGTHRWNATWETMSPQDVEAAVRRAKAAWDVEEPEEPEPPR